jgi:hypothetical protein
LPGVAPVGWRYRRHPNNVTAEVAAAVQDAPRRTRPSGLRRPAPWMVFWAMFGMVLTLTLIRNAYVFTRRIYEGGDFALNSFLVNHTHTSLQLVGNDSRVGFSHPGPAYIYVISAGQTLFHDLLHLAPSQYGAQFIGDSILQAMMLALIVMSLYRVTGSLVAVTLGASILFAFAATHEMIGYVWLPCMYMTAFALLLAAGTAVAAGYTAELPLLVVAGGFLVHGHVAFILFVVVTSAAIAIGWWLGHRRHWRDELRGHRRAVRWSIALAALFAAPLILEVTLHYPGPWPAYVRYTLNHGRTPHSLADSVRFLGQYWTTIRIPTALYIAAALVAAAMLVIDRRSRRCAYFTWGYGILALETGLFLYYIVRGIDVLGASNYYTGYFYETVPLFLILLAFVHAAMVVHSRLAAKAATWRRFAIPVAVTVVAAALIVTRATAQGFTDLYRGNDAFAAIVTALRDDPVRAGRPVLINFVQAEWGPVAGVMIQADRSDLRTCIDDRSWTRTFTAASMCTTVAGHFPVTIEPRTTWNDRGTVVWSNATLVVFQTGT